MHMSTVTVRNFRCLQDVAVHLGPGLNVVVGRNNIGKTNLFSAIRHAIGPSGSHGDPLWLTKDDFFCGRDRKRADTIQIDLVFECLNNAQLAKFYEIVDFDTDDLARSKALLHFEAAWPEGKKHPTIRRWGGPPAADKTHVPSEILEALPVTFLPALRDAEAALTPGNRSRLALLLRDWADRITPNPKAEIEEVFKKANKELEAKSLIADVKNALRTSTRTMAGTDYEDCGIAAAESNFEKILRTLRVQMEQSPLQDLSANGLGYNNVLFIATVLAHLEKPSGDECPILLVEEPEAHLHPQLTILLGQYLTERSEGGGGPQTVVSTHSPTLASSVQPSRVLVLFSSRTEKKITCNSLARVGFDPREERELQRMLDVTKATLYFSKGLILVEGICEALLVPILAQRLRHDLRKLHVSVVPICGVAFGAFRKLFEPNGLGIPVAILTDADPEVIRGETWNEDSPRETDGVMDQCDRTKKLVSMFGGHPTVGVFPAELTLEYDLALAGDHNAMLMAEVWESCFDGKPSTLNKSRILEAGANPRSKAIAVWRGICRAEHSGSKADFAHRLADRLDLTETPGEFKDEFAVPPYIRQAVEFVVSKVATGPATAVGTDK